MNDASSLMSIQQEDPLPKPPQQQQEQREARTEQPPPPEPSSSSSTAFHVLSASPLSADGNVVRYHDDDHHNRTRSADSFAEITSEVFGTAAYAASPTKPPPAPRRKSLDEERYHGRNLKFLLQAEKEKSRMVPPPAPFARTR
jgi:hypothetical protein